MSDSFASLQRADRAVDEAPLVGQAIHLPRGAGKRPWLLVRPDREALSELRIVNVFEAVRFRAENAALGLAPEDRFAGVTIARGLDESLDTYEARERMAELLGDTPPRSIQLSTTEDSDLPRRWSRMFRAMVHPWATEVPLTAETSLEFDLGMDSLDRLSFLIAVGDALCSPMSEDAMVEIYTLGDVVAAYEGHVPPNEGWATSTIDAVLEEGPHAEIRSEWIKPPVWSWPAIRLARLFVRGYTRFRMPLDVVGLDRLDLGQRPLIFACNHQAHIDAAMLLSALPVNAQRSTFFLGFGGYFAHGWGRVLAELMRICPISADEHVLSGLRTAAAGLRNGQILAIYPEGERSWNGSLRPLRRGVAWLARHTQARVVPVAIVGSYVAWPRGGQFKPKPLKLVFGRPLDPPGDEIDADVAFLRSLRAALGDSIRRGGADPDEGYPDVWATPMGRS